MKQTKILLIGILLLASLLRFYKIDHIPQGLYIDEISVGYDAFTILTQGKDEYGTPYPLFFPAFGEYKMPVGIYLTSLSMALFGKTEFAVRSPSALFGTLSVLLLYFLVKELFRKRSIALLSSFLLAVSPWHIQFSRAGFEANIALFLYLVGGFFFLQYLRHKKITFLIGAMIAFITTLYTYNAYKLISPITLFICLFYLYKKMPSIRNRLWFFVGGIGLLLLPIIFLFEGNARFFETSAFSEYPTLSSLHYPLLYVTNYLTFFSLPYLFATGDGFGRHSVTGIGPFFRWELPFLLVGLFYLFKQKKQFFAKVLLFLLLIAPVTAALTRPSPHLLRSFLLVIPLTILIAYGLVMLWKKKNKFIKMLFFGVACIGLYEFSFYIHLYYTHYPNRSALDWGGAYKEVIVNAAKLQKDYPYIVVNSKVGMLSSYGKFYDENFHYELINTDTWEKPTDSKRKILYITTSDPKKNPYLEKISHKLLKNIYLPSSHNGIFVQFWEI